MRSLSLLPYCPLPVNTGARVVLMKHLNMLREMGDCTILSALKKPVGYGWSSQYIKKLQEDGFNLVFRPNPGATVRQWYGLAYASFFKIFRQERAFGHSNPYHRTAFPEDWWVEQTESADLAEIHYSYWSHLSCACPKIVVVHDLWSNIMWEGGGKETLDLKTADLIVTVSNDDRNTLRKRGLDRVIWSPPSIKGALFDDSSKVGIVGSDNRFNKEGIGWLTNARQLEHAAFKIVLYGSVGNFANLSSVFTAYGSYKDSFFPYEQCGIIIIPTGLGTGLQIKAIEALAAGRAIVARKGAMRGFPDSEIGWIEVETPEEMVERVEELVNDSGKRKKQMRLSRAYYHAHLESNKVLEELKSAYLDVVQHA